MTRLEEACLLAMNAHRGQIRKGLSQTPYIGHLWVVTGTVMEYTQDEDTHIAAMLHDYVEDCGGKEALSYVEHKFGPEVAKIVLECSDSVAGDKDSKLPWRERKEKAIAGIPEKSEAACTILAADKLHNATCTLEDLYRRGENAFGMFKGKKEGTLWYLRTYTNELLYTTKVPRGLAYRLQSVVAELVRVANDPKI